MWELDGWDGLAANFAHETAGGRDQDPSLAEWWAAAASLRRGGVDRIVVPTPWTRSVERAHAPTACAARCTPTSWSRVPPGHERRAARRGRARGPRRGAGAGRRAGRRLRGGDGRRLRGAAALGHPRLVDVGRLRAGLGARRRAGAAGARRSSASARRWRRQLLVDSPLNPLRTGRQPQASDRRPLERDLSAAEASQPARRSPTTAIDRLRARINVPEPWPQPPHHRVITTDTFRHVAEAYGDDNPLWCDPAYGATTRWGGPIAPPPLVGGDTLVGVDEVTEVPADQKAIMQGDPLRGVHAFYSSSAREWWAPMEPGHGGHPPQRAGRRARQAERVRRAGGARVVGAGVPRRRRPAAVGAAPQHDPHRAHQGAGAQEVRRGRDPRLHRRRDRGHRGAVRRARRRAAPSRAGGRTSPRATRSARW